MPMSISYGGNDWDEKWEGERFISLENRQKVVIFKETHGSVSDLKVWTRDALNKSLEESLNQIFQLCYFADLQNLQKFGQKHDFFGRVSERPVSQQSFH
jgi:hypothetical protein